MGTEKMVRRDVTASILQSLSTIETVHNVRILYACDFWKGDWIKITGSHNRVIPFLFVTLGAEYTQVGTDSEFESIHWKSSDTLCHFIGWDIQCYFIEVSKSNVSMLEWMTAETTVFIRMHTIVDQLRDLVRNTIDWTIVQNNYLKPITGLTSYSKYGVCYTRELVRQLRNIFAAQHITEHRELPPNSFNELIDASSVPHNVKEYTRKLLGNFATNAPVEKRTRRFLVKYVQRMLQLTPHNHAQVAPINLSAEFQDVVRDCRAFFELRLSDNVACAQSM